MSWQAARAVLDLRGMDPTAKWVLAAIALRANGDGRAWPSVAQVCEDTGLARGTVYDALRRLRLQGRIEVVHRVGTSSIYGLGGPGDGHGCPADRGLVREIPDPPRPGNSKKRAISRTRKSKEEINEERRPARPASRPAVAGVAGASTNGHAYPQNTTAHQERARDRRRAAAAACGDCDDEGVSLTTGVWCKH